MKTKKTSSLEVRKLKSENLALEEENLRLQREIAKLKAKLVSAQNGIIVDLEGKLPEKLTDAELNFIAAGGLNKQRPSRKKLKSTS